MFTEPHSVPLVESEETKAIVEKLSQEVDERIKPLDILYQLHAVRRMSIEVRRKYERLYEQVRSMDIMSEDLFESLFYIGDFDYEDSAST